MTARLTAMERGLSGDPSKEGLGVQRDRDSSVLVDINSVRGRQIIERRIALALSAARQYNRTARQLRTDERGGQHTTQHTALIAGCIHRAKQERDRAALLASFISGGAA